MGALFIARALLFVLRKRGFIFFIISSNLLPSLSIKGAFISRKTSNRLFRNPSLEKLALLTGFASLLPSLVRLKFEVITFIKIYLYRFDITSFHLNQYIVILLFIILRICVYLALNSPGFIKLNYTIFNFSYK